MVWVGWVMSMVDDSVVYVVVTLRHVKAVLGDI